MDDESAFEQLGDPVFPIDYTFFDLSNLSKDHPEAGYNHLGSNLYKHDRNCVCAYPQKRGFGFHGYSHNGKGLPTQTGRKWIADIEAGLKKRL